MEDRRKFLGEAALLGSALIIGVGAGGLSQCSSTSAQTLTKDVIDKIQAAVAEGCSFIPTVTTLIAIIGAFPALNGAAAITTELLNTVVGFLCKSYMNAGGADAALFQINATSGVLSFINAPNFEVRADDGGNNVYDVTVQVSDGALTDTQAIAVTVTNLNEAPVITSNGGGATAAVSIAEKMAPYRHPRLSSIKVGGDQNHPILVRDGVTAQEVLAEMMGQIIESGVVPTQIAGMLEASRGVVRRGIDGGDHRCETTLLKPK